jgi:PilZ domain
VRQVAERERRHYRRFPQLLELEAHLLPPIDSEKKTTISITGRVQNISKGGICILTYQPLVRSALLRCEIIASDGEVGVPTIMQVCWTRKQQLPLDSYISGLRFLL